MREDELNEEVAVTVTPVQQGSVDASVSLNVAGITLPDVVRIKVPVYLKGNTFEIDLESLSKKLTDGQEERGEEHKTLKFSSAKPLADWFINAPEDYAFVIDRHGEPWIIFMDDDNNGMRAPFLVSNFVEDCYQPVLDFKNYPVQVIV